MSKTIKTKITCPKCKIAQECILYASMNVSVEPELKKDFVSNKWNIFNCNNCENIVPILSNMMYHDINNEFVVWYAPKGIDDQEIKSAKRYNRLLGKGSYFSKPIVVENREDVILMVHLCDKNGPPKSDEERDKYFQAIKKIREIYRK